VILYLGRGRNRIVESFEFYLVVPGISCLDCVPAQGISLTKRRFRDLGDYGTTSARIIYRCSSGSPIYGNSCYFDGMSKLDQIGLFSK
jgi:hypothetical protein